MDPTNNNIYSRGAKVVVTYNDTVTFTGIVMNSGSQSQKLVYLIMIDNPENYPTIDAPAGAVIVDADIVKLDVRPD
jgi:hypothetical protein